MKKVFAAVLFGSLAAWTHAADRPNILFIAIDDLRPELGCYGSELAKSPNLDALAKNGLLFNRAYCQQAICSPSRASLMTGARPDTIGIVENSAYFRERNPDIVTLSQHFIKHGYEAVYCGKIFHKDDHADRENSWSRDPAHQLVPFDQPGDSFALPENQAILEANKRQLEKKYGPGISATGLVQGPAYECADVSDQTYRDGYNTDLAIATMKDMVDKGDKPFFLGLGFYKPHLNFIAPKKYWDLYDRDEITLAEHTDAPASGAAMGLHASFELRVRDGIPKGGPIDRELALTLKHAYLACVSYIDTQVSRMLEALEEEGLRENTIIIVWGDHGWHLGIWACGGRPPTTRLQRGCP